jgi:streptogramin lyase
MGPATHGSPRAGRARTLDIETETFEEFEAPGSDDRDSSPKDIAVNSGGAVWFTDVALGHGQPADSSDRTICLREAYRTPAKSLNTSRVGALGIAIDSSNTIWCTCGTDLVMVDPFVRSAVHPIPQASKPYGIFAERGGIWVVDQHQSRLHRFGRGRPDFQGNGWSIPLVRSGNLEDSAPWIWNLAE